MQALLCFSLGVTARLGVLGSTNAFGCVGGGSRAGGRSGRGSFLPRPTAHPLSLSCGGFPLLTTLPVGGATDRPSTDFKIRQPPSASPSLLPEEFFLTYTSFFLTS